MSALPSTERLLLGPGPSPVSPRVMRAMAAPVLGHLDPALLAIMDDLRARLGRVFRAPDDTLALAVSGTGTSGMETALANVVGPGKRLLVVATGYFGERLVEIGARLGADVARVDGEWGRAIDPDAVRQALEGSGADVVAAVHAETSTGVLNPVAEIASLAHARGALMVADTVTSLGAHPVEVGAWGLDVCYSGTQKGLGAPSGLAPLAVGPRAMERRLPCRSFYLDIGLLQDYWAGRKYHHTISATLVYALREALAAVEDEGLEARWQRHERHHRMFTAGLEAMGLGLLPPEGERLWTLHAVRVPDGVNEAAVRTELRDAFNIEIGAGMGPLAGKIWRIGLMGAGSTPSIVLLLLAALEKTLTRQGFKARPGAGTAAALELVEAGR